MNFKTSTDHCQYLKALYHGGTQHTWADIPHRDGLWGLGRGGPAFVQGANGPVAAIRAGGDIIKGVLTRAYEAAFQERRDTMAKVGQQPYDRLTTCEPAGMPRWLNEPDVREFVNTPTESWWLNDLNNDTRRIYIGQDHKNLENTHFPEGDSVGFWAGDYLIVHTIDVWPNDWGRGTPPTSNQFVSVEIFHHETLANGDDAIIDQATFYDTVALAKPISTVYVFTHNVALEQQGWRIQKLAS